MILQASSPGYPDLPSLGQGMELSWGLPSMAGRDFGILRLPLPLHRDFSARPTALPALPFLLLPGSCSKLSYSSQSSPPSPGRQNYPSDTIQTQIR